MTGNKNKMKVGLYSITYLGCWFKDRPLTWQEVLRKAKDFGFDGVEFDAKRPHANPMDWDQDTRKAVVDYAGELGLELPALAANNNFASPVAEEREAQLLMVREQIKLAADLGCKSLRVFASWPGITLRDGWANYDEARKEWANGWRGVPKLIRWNYMTDCFKEAARMAGDYGIVLALQNHEPLVGNWRDCLKVVNEVDSPHLKICFDLPPHEDNVENITTAINTIGHLDILFHYNGEFDRLPNGKLHVTPSFGYPSIHHYGHLVNELQRIGYDGYLNWEFCHCVIDKNGNQGEIKYVDEQTKLALEYMRELVSEAERLYPSTT
ncbi:MAG: sugar phosphate isomerase/epimerase [Tannerellaceae bacterium]|jgi:sugar phosphate isomerase/epimerase|nr:sugar phosphate isomerase/epimerase [Tannerellaceae bacterium]